MSRENEFHHDSLQELASLAEYMAEMTRALEAGELTLSDGESQIVLEPKGLIRFELSGFERPNQAGFTVTVSWQPRNHVSPRDLQISGPGDEQSTDS